MARSYMNDEGLDRFCAALRATAQGDIAKVDMAWSIASWNGLINEDCSNLQRGRPFCYFKPSCVSDVEAACKLAVKHEVKVSARGSGHHYGGVSLMEGSVLLDLSNLKHVEVDPTGRTARVGPAATARQLRAAMAPHHLHFTVPHLSDVGLSGYILGGGNGWGVRHWGAAADNVVEMEVVLLESGAPGTPSDATGGCRAVRVTAESDPELFWGLRGGGAFLGVVTEFVLRLFPVAQSLPLIAARYPLSYLDKVAEFFREFHRSNPTCVEASLSLIAAPEPADAAGPAPPKPVAEGPQEAAASTATTKDTADLTAASPAEPTAAAAGRVGAVERPQHRVENVVVLVACTTFAETGSPEVEASYAQLRNLLPEARLSLDEGPMPYDAALSILDPAWQWPGLRMYAHGAFVQVDLLRTNDPRRAGGADRPDSERNGCSQGFGNGNGAAGGTAAGAGAGLAGAGGTGCGDFLSVLREAALTMTSRRSIFLVCPSAPSTPGYKHGSHSHLLGGANGGTEGGGNGAQRAANGGNVDGAAALDEHTAGALGFRDTFYVGVYGMWSRSEAGPAADGDAEHVAWVRRCATSLEPLAAGLYVNEVMHDDNDEDDEKFDENNQRSGEGGDLNHHANGSIVDEGSPGMAAADVVSGAKVKVMGRSGGERGGRASQVQRSYEPAAYERLVALKRRVDPQGLLRQL